MDLIDTNLVSELRKVRSGKPDPGVAAWADGVDASSLFLSSITLHELELGVLLAERRDPIQGSLLRHWLQQAVVPAFAGRLLAVDAAIALRSAALHGSDPKLFRDGLITATAVVHSLVVVTRNLADFEATGVPLLNPWQKGLGRSAPMAANACTRRPPCFCCACGPGGDCWRPCGRVLKSAASLRQVMVM